MKYIALLRGINVGGKNKVPMNDLKDCFKNAEFQNVVTYINSGNVIFDSEEHSIPSLIKQCSELLERTLGFPISLAIIDVPALKEALDHAPEWWGNDPESKHNAIFIIQPATAEEIIAEAGEIKPEYEKLYAYKDIIFWSAPLKTFSRSRWSKVVGTRAYQNITIRNSNTAKALLDLAQKSIR